MIILSWYIKKCERCGKEFNAIYKGPGAKYCYNCSEYIKKENSKRSRISRKMRGRNYSKKPKRGDKCKICHYPIIYALEYSHEINDFLCANCHAELHQRFGKNISLNELLGIIMERNCNFAIPSNMNVFNIYVSCFLCNNDKVLEKHHMIPRVKGGNDHPTNIMLLCPNCHRIITKFGEKLFNEWYQKYNDKNTSEIDVMKSFYVWLKDNWEDILRNI